MARKASFLWETAKRLLGLPLTAAAIVEYKYVSSVGKDDANSWIRRSAEIDGWIYDGEHEFLWELAQRPGAGHILEIGSWLGKSTCILAGACARSAPETKVFCIDTFDMRGTELQDRIHRSVRGGAPGTFYEFIENAKKHGFYDRIVVVASPSEAALPALTERFRMVFIDGMHDYDQVRKEAELCLPLLNRGGILALHDTSCRAWPGIDRYVEENLMHDPRVRRIERRNTLTAFEKIADAA
ncbi:MAG: class I SAM-dependent methyltransferase [Elusimicrobiota bacterium]